MSEATVEFYSRTTYDETVTEWRWRVRAGNREIVASGEGHTSEHDAKRAFIDAADAMQEAAAPHR